MSGDVIETMAKALAAHAYIPWDDTSESAWTCRFTCETTGANGPTGYAAHIAAVALAVVRDELADKALREATAEALFVRFLDLSAPNESRAEWAWSDRANWHEDEDGMSGEQIAAEWLGTADASLSAVADHFGGAE